MEVIFRLSFAICKIKVANMSGADRRLPEAEFVNAPMQGPPVGLDVGDFDSGEFFRGNASAGNEQGGKLQSVLQYLHMFEENSITDLLGYKHTVLSRRQGGEGEGGTGGCLKPAFFQENKKLTAFFRPAYLLLPGGDSGGLIPVTPTFNGIPLDKPMDPVEDGDGMMMSDGNWAAWLKLDGYDAEIIVQSAGDNPPSPPSNVSDGVVWNLAKWSIEGSGDDDVKVVNEEYYACPFVPATDRNTHSFYPTLYQKKTEIGDDGDSSWYMKVYYGNVHDLHKGEHHKVERCDNETEILVNSGETWYFKLKTSNLGVPEELTITSEAPEVTPFQPPEKGVTDETPDEGAGTYKWKLFEITAAGDKLVARIFHSGDISWYRWLHDNLLGDAEPVEDRQARVYKRFNQDTYKHEFRHIVAGDRIKVLEGDDKITISWISDDGSGG